MFSVVRKRNRLIEGVKAYCCCASLATQWALGGLPRGHSLSVSKHLLHQSRYSNSWDQLAMLSYSLEEGGALNCPQRVKLEQKENKNTLIWMFLAAPCWSASQPIPVAASIAHPCSSPLQSLFCSSLLLRGKLRPDIPQISKAGRGKPKSWLSHGRGFSCANNGSRKIEKSLSHYPVAKFK